MGPGFTEHERVRRWTSVCFVLQMSFATSLLPPDVSTCMYTVTPTLAPTVSKGLSLRRSSPRAVPVTVCCLAHCPFRPCT